MRKTALCLWPVMPEASAKMLTQLGQEACAERAPTARLEEEIGGLDGLEPGTVVAEASNLFPRIDVKKGDAPRGGAEQGRQQKARAGEEAKTVSPAAPQPPASPKGTADFEQFKGLDIRVGTVKKAEKHPNADRILRLEIDFGEGMLRQILSGLAEHYAPEELVGKRVCAVLNLAPRKIRGLVSYGMVLTAGDDAHLGLLAVDRDVPDGSEIA